MIIKLFLFFSAFAASTKAQISIEGTFNLTLAAEQLNMTVEEASELFQVGAEQAQVDGVAEEDAAMQDLFCFPGQCDTCNLCPEGQVPADPSGTLGAGGLGINCALTEILGAIGSLSSGSCFLAQLAVQNRFFPQCGGCVEQVIEPCVACGPPEDFVLNEDEPALEFLPITCGDLDAFLMDLEIDSRICGGVQDLLEVFADCQCNLSPSSAPSAAPSESAAPSDVPSGSPSSTPSSSPSSSPSSTPSSSPSSSPSSTPSSSPSDAPSSSPSGSPSSLPSESIEPSATPSSMPSASPSESFAPTMAKGKKGGGKKSMSMEMEMEMEMDGVMQLPGAPLGKKGGPGLGRGGI